MDKRSIEMSSNDSKKIRLISEDDQCKEESERSLQSLTIKLEDLPDEVILKVFSYLENTPDRIRSGHLSQRLRAISSDKSLWQKRIHSKKLYPHRDRFSNLYWIEEI